MAMGWLDGRTDGWMDKRSASSGGRVRDKSSEKFLACVTRWSLLLSCRERKLGREVGGTPGKVKGRRQRPWSPRSLQEVLFYLPLSRKKHSDLFNQPLSVFHKSQISTLIHFLRPPWSPEHLLAPSPCPPPFWIPTQPAHTSVLTTTDEAGLPHTEQAL